MKGIIHKAHQKSLETKYVLTTCLRCLEPYQLSQDRYKYSGRGTCPDCLKKLKGKGFKR